MADFSARPRPPLVVRYMPPRTVDALFGIPERTLELMRYKRRGPPFRYFRDGQRRPMYEVGSLQEWINQQPGRMTTTAQ